MAISVCYILPPIEFLPTPGFETGPGQALDLTQWRIAHIGCEPAPPHAQLFCATVRGETVAVAAPSDAQLRASDGAIPTKHARPWSGCSGPSDPNSTIAGSEASGATWPKFSQFPPPPRPGPHVCHRSGDGSRSLVAWKVRFVVAQYRRGFLSMPPRLVFQNRQALPSGRGDT